MTGATFQVVLMGSPPHTWRILTSMLAEKDSERITSTHVENTACLLRYENLYWDHLHTRGEYPETEIRTDRRWGSPPHTWRILQMKEMCLKTLRITSTHVENTLKSGLITKSNRDHLHTRGEYLNRFWCVITNPGSPPHTWRIQQDLLH